MRCVFGRSHSNSSGSYWESRKGNARRGAGVPNRPRSSVAAVTLNEGRCSMRSIAYLAGVASSEIRGGPGAIGGSWPPVHLPELRAHSGIREGGSRLLISLIFFRDLKSAFGFNRFSPSVPVGRQELRRRSSGPSSSVERRYIFRARGRAWSKPTPHVPKHDTSCWSSTGQGRTVLAVLASSRFPTPVERGIPGRHPNARGGDLHRLSCRDIETPAERSVVRADRRRLLWKTVA